MKKLLSVLLVVALMLSMVACGGNADDKDEVVTAKVIDVELTQEEYAFGVDKTQPELLKQVNETSPKCPHEKYFDFFFLQKKHQLYKLIIQTNGKAACERKL